jgi:hypothetical protein
MKVKIPESTLKEENPKVAHKEEHPKERREDSTHIGKGIDESHKLSIVSMGDS